MKLKTLLLLLFALVTSLGMTSASFAGTSVPKENMPETVKKGEYPAVGKSYDVNFGIFKGRAEILSESQMRFTSEDNKMTSNIEMKVTMIRPNLFQVVWVDKSGVVQVHIQDFERNIIYANVINEPGEEKLVQLKGTFTPSR